MDIGGLSGPQGFSAPIAPEKVAEVKKDLKTSGEEGAVSAAAPSAAPAEPQKTSGTNPDSTGKVYEIA